MCCSVPMDVCAFREQKKGVGSPGTEGTGGFDFLILVLGTKLQSSEE